MIKFHPSEQALALFARGELPSPMTVAIAAHIEFCGECQSHLEEIEQSLAQSTFSSPAPEAALDDALLAMMDDITQSQVPDSLSVQAQKSVNINGRNIRLPRALSHIGLSSFMQAGKLSRARLDITEDDVRASLLYISAGGSIPEHTHTGTELTLLLDGTFSDEQGSYVPGDFILLDSEHNHTPYTENGCLCLAVVDSPLHFNKGLSRLLNPIGELIY